MGFLDIKNELIKYAYDPNMVQIDLYKYMETLMDGNDIPDPTNPFMFLIESNATVGSTLLEQMVINLRKLYPSLATTREDLYHHMINREYDNVFAYPSITTFHIYISIDQIKQFGIKKEQYYEITIPMYTRIIVKNYYSFMFLNDVIIRYFESTNKSVVILMPNKLSISLPGNRILKSHIVTDNDGNGWILFDVELKQLDMIYDKQSIIPVQGFNKTYELNDQFHTIFSKLTTEVGEIDTCITFSDFVYDIKNPVLRCSLKDEKTLKTTLYDTYTKNFNITNISNYIYTTKGEVILNFDNYIKDDFTMDFSLPTQITGKTPAITSFTPIILSSSYTSGGRNMLDLEDLRKLVIYNTTGDNKLPITTYDIEEKLSRYGYELDNTIDTILKREYVVKKKLVFIEDQSYLYSNPDVFMDTLEITHEEIANLPNSVTIDNGIGIIRPMTFFKKDGYKFKLVSQTDVDKLKTLTEGDLSEVLRKEKYFYNTFKYIFDFKDGVFIRVYEVNTPKVIYSKSEYYNANSNFVLELVNTTVLRNGKDYVLKLRYNADDSFRNIPNNFRKAMLVFKPNNSMSKIAIKGEIGDEEITFRFNVSDYIGQDDTVELMDFISVLDHVRIGNVIKNAKLYIYVTDPTVLGKINNTYTREIEQFDSEVANVIAVSNLSLELFKRAKYLFTNYRVSPNLRIYKKYENDVYLTYKEDVLATDEDGNYIFEKIDTNGDGIEDTEIVKILHKKGDLVLDEEGNPILIHKKGEVILDDNSKPIIDYTYGFDHYIDILTFELEFLLTKDKDYRTFMISKYLELDNYIFNELEELNSMLLENTKILYKPTYNLRDVEIIKNNVTFHTPFIVKPTVTLYVIDDVTDSIKLEELKRKTGLALQYAIRKFNKRIDMDKYILNRLNDSNIQFVKVENLDNLGEIEIYEYTPTSNMFSVSKKLAPTLTGIYVPELDYELKLIKV